MCRNLRELQSTASPVPKEERTNEFLKKFYDEAVIASARRGYVHNNVANFDIVPLCVKSQLYKFDNW